MNNRGLCWYCYWGWPKPIADVFAKYGDLVGTESLEYGRGHIVWADENFDDESIRWCIEEAGPNGEDDPTVDALVIESLKELAMVPKEMREAAEHLGYDLDDPDQHPAEFPPPKEWGMRMSA